MSRPLELVLAPLAPGELWAYSIATVEWRDNGSSGAVRGAGDFRRTNDLVNSLRSVEAGGISLPDTLVYRGVSLWQFLPSYLWPAFHRAAELIDALLPVIESSGAGALVAAPATGPDATVWPATVKAVADALGREAVTTEAPPALDVVAAVRSVDRARAAAGVLRRRLRSSGFRHGRGARRLVAATLGNRHWVPRLGSSARWDEQISPLIGPLQAQGYDDILVVDVQDMPRSELAARDGNGVSWRPFRDFERRAAAPETADARSLLADPAFRRAFSYRGVSLVTALEHELEDALTSLLPATARDLATAAAILHAQRPEAVLATYETGPRGRALIVEAARRGIPSVGLMHGMIFDNHYDYMHDAVTAAPLDEPTAFAIPEQTCVWGPFWRDVLVKRGSYPNRAVSVTGNWRYDSLLRVAPTKDELRTLLGVPEGKAAVAVLTGSRDVARFLDVATAAVAAVGAWPLVKLHPGDHEEYGTQALTAHGFPAAALVRERFAETLLASDAVISQVSTAIGEAAYLDRPVVVVALDDAGGWEQDLAALEAVELVRNPDAVASALAAALRDEEVRRRLAHGREDLVAQWFLDRSGEAADRVAGAVTALSGTRG
jgi:hypothetical protein